MIAPSTSRLTMSRLPRPRGRRWATLSSPPRRWRSPARPRRPGPMTATDYNANFSMLGDDVKEKEKEKLEEQDPPCPQVSVALCCHLGGGVGGELASEEVEELNRGSSTPPSPAARPCRRQGEEA